MTYLNRDSIISKLRLWVAKKQNEIFVIDGPNQIGKTHLINEFFTYYPYSHIYIDVYQNKNTLEKLLDDVNATAENFYSSICFHFNLQMSQNLTCLIFDGIEYCPRLRQFFKTLVDYQKINIIAITCGGLSSSHYKNLLVPSEENVNYLFPMNFKEFLMVIGQQSLENHLLNTIINKEPTSEFLSEELYKFFKLYCLIGGFPKVVEKYIQSKDIVSCIAANKKILARQFEHATSLLNEEDKALMNDISKDIYQIVRYGKYNHLSSISIYKMKQLLLFLEDEYILNIPTALDINEPTNTSSGKTLYFFHQSFSHASNINFSHETYFDDLFLTESDVMTDYFFNQRIELNPIRYGISRIERYVNTDALLIIGSDMYAVEFKSKRLSIDYNLKITAISDGRIKPGLLLYNGHIFKYNEVTILPSYCSSFVSYCFNINK